MLGKIIVGRGILDAPSLKLAVPPDPYLKPSEYGRDAELQDHQHPDTLLELSEYGRNVAQAIEYLNHKASLLTIEKYVIMPNHVHCLVIIDNLNDQALSSGASGMPRPTNALVPKLISSIKRYTNKKAGFNLWQSSYHDHIIRDQEDYIYHRQYIEDNPSMWLEDEYNNKGLTP